MIPLQCEIVVLASDLLLPTTKVANWLSRAQSAFQFSSFPLRSEDQATLAAVPLGPDGYLSTEAVYPTVHAFLERIKGNHPYVVVVTASPLKSPTVENLFSNSQQHADGTSPKLAIISTAGVQDNIGALPIEAYLAHHLLSICARWAAGPMMHRDGSELCFFHKKFDRRTMATALREWRVCDACNVKLGVRLDGGQLKSLRTAMDTAYYALSNDDQAQANEAFDVLLEPGVQVAPVPSAAVIQPIARLETTPLRPEAMAEFHQGWDALRWGYTGVMGFRVLAFALLTLIPVVLVLKIHSFRLTVTPASALYLVYHAVGAYLWFEVSQAEKMRRFGTAPTRTLVWLGKVRSFLTIPVMTLILLTLGAAAEFEYNGKYQIPIPEFVYPILGIPVPAPPAPATVVPRRPDTETSNRGPADSGNRALCPDADNPALCLKFDATGCNCLSRLKKCLEAEPCDGVAYACYFAGGDSDNTRGLYFSKQAGGPETRLRTDQIAFGPWSNPECHTNGTGWSAFAGSCGTNRGARLKRCSYVLVDDSRIE